MSLGKQPLIALNVQKHHQIEHIHADGINLGGIGGDEGIRFGVQDGGNGFEHEARVVRRDLKRLGNGLRVNTGLRAVGEDELRNWEKAVLERLSPRMDVNWLGGSGGVRRRRRRWFGSVLHGFLVNVVIKSSEQR
nr:hypothetical protein Iba_chr10dCG2500 [Ipomoea batatas]